MWVSSEWFGVSPVRGSYSSQTPKIVGLTIWPLPILFRCCALIRRHLLPKEIAVLPRLTIVGIGDQRRTQPAIGLNAVALHAGPAGVHRAQPVACPRIFLG